MNPTDSHLTAEVVQRYFLKSLRPAERLAASDHAANCPACRRLLETATKETPRRSINAAWQSGGDGLFHLTYEMMRSHMKGELDALDRELLESHLTDCEPCKRELEDLVRYGQTFRSEAGVSKTPVEEEVPDSIWTRKRAKPTTSRFATWWENWTSRWLLAASAGAAAALVTLLAIPHLTLTSTQIGPSSMTTAQNMPEARPADVLKDGGQTFAVANGQISRLPSQLPPALRRDMENVLAGAPLPSAGILSMNQGNSRGTALSQGRISGPIAQPAGEGPGREPAGYTLEQVNLQCPGSHLARGLAFWKSGDVTRAKKEFEALAADNPSSATAARLLAEVNAAAPLINPLHAVPR